MFFVFISFVYTISACFYSPSHWLSDASLPWPEQLHEASLCGVSYHHLLHLNISKSASDDALYWLLVFRQLCVAKLNILTSVASSSPEIPTPLELSIAYLLDGMAHRCDNLSHYIEETRADGVMREHLTLVLDTVRRIKTCETLDTKVFAFDDAPQLFFLDYNESALIRENQATLGYTYKIVNFLIGALVIAYFLIIPGLFIMVLMLRDRRRAYSWLATTSDDETQQRQHEDDEEWVHVKKR